MAMGGKPDQRKLKNFVLEDKMIRIAIKREDNSLRDWHKKWYWLLDEYEKLHEKLGEITQESEFLSSVNKDTREKDTRSILPLPATTNHMYGKLASMPEFKLEKYTTDVYKPPCLPSMYRLFNPYA